MEELIDSSLMPYGKYKGQKMIDVPAHYLIWLYDNGCSPQVKKYVKDSYDALMQELQDLKSNKK